MLFLSLAAMLALFAYLPAISSPARFLSQIRMEHELQIGVWGAEKAVRILERAVLTTTDATGWRGFLVTPDVDPRLPSGNASVADHVGEASRRLLDNPYVQTIKALATLAIYRWSSVLEWMPLISAFVVALMFDAALRRRIKTKEFLHHNPETFAIGAWLFALTACAAAITSLLPITLHPCLLPIGLLMAGVSLALTIANFHARA